MNRIDQRFRARRESGRKLLIPYIVAGDPSPGETVALMHELAAAGADVIELGVPFSDPMADGPVIQQACERALVHDVTLRDVFGMVAEFRKGDDETPVVLMGYLNPIEILGYETAAELAAEAGVDGLLTVDLPPEEGELLVPELEKRGLDAIWLIAPTTRAERIRQICDLAHGFVYYVSLKGVTGASTLDVDDVAAHVEAIRAATELPVGVGFGISDGESAARVSEVADAVVVGSAIVRRIGENAGDAAAMRQAVTELLRSMRRAIDAAAPATA
ncbi:tryptophan synthase subunit alpha [Ectothiorhodospiraceae bacterium WFHF3C12]|nr:tryptophan synthase subunit alpha [Ectothiorhodospiraceae bacterium WFHF3C12]